MHPPRKYQALAVELARTNPHRLNLQLPPGYGKTKTAALCYAAKHHAGDVTRLLVVVPRTAQHRQYLEDFGAEIAAAGLPGPHTVTDISDSGTRALRRDRGGCHVFVVTIQALVSSKHTWDAVVELLERGRWMLVIDEYHHYGLDRAWTKRLDQLEHVVFKLPMSATPNRPGDDGAFGAPDLRCLYREACAEHAVKTLRGASYTYSVEIQGGDGVLKTYTTHELIELLGTDDPDAFEAEFILRNFRWSPKYIAPLVDRPIQRVIRQRAKLGLPLQVVIKAMCCSHAELVCQQVREIYPELRVDWVGTGPHGRPEDDNAAVMARFCPIKRNHIRDPRDIELDVLVQVGIAGEGVDTVYVTEVVFLSLARGTNQDHQLAGRAARVFPAICGVPAADQVAHINFDSTSEYADYTGDRIMDALDELPPGDAGTPSEPDDEPKEPRPLNPDPDIRIIDLSCIEVDEGEVARMSEAVVAVVKERHPDVLAAVYADLKDPHSPLQEHVQDMYRRLRQREADQFNDASLLQQWKHHVEAALQTVAIRAALRLTKASDEVPRMIGRVKTCVNWHKKQQFGRKGDLEVAGLKASYRWLLALDEQMIQHGGVPQWIVVDVRKHR